MGDLSAASFEQNALITALNVCTDARGWAFDGGYGAIAFFDVLLQLELWEGNFSWPNGIGIDALGMILVTDNGNSNDRIVRFSGTLFQ
jgi:hypothetical protein